MIAVDMNRRLFQKYISLYGKCDGQVEKDWGMNDVWNSIVYPRFERLNALTGTQCFGHWENKDGKKFSDGITP